MVRTVLTCCLLAIFVGASFGKDIATSLPEVTPKQIEKVRCFIEPSKTVEMDHSVVYKEARIFFSSAGAVKKFEQDPKSFEAFANHQLVRTGQYVQHACPLSGEAPDEDSVVITIAGVKVTLLCADCAKEIAKEPLKEQITTLFDEEGFRFGKFALREKPDDSGR